MGGGKRGVRDEPRFIDWLNSYYEKYNHSIDQVDHSSA